MLPVPGSKGAFVELLGCVGNTQILRVHVVPGGEIPLHTHDCNSGMGITAGSARTLGKECDRLVRPGDYIYKPAGTPHGFTSVGEEGFEFISISDGEGIFQGENWDLSYAIV